MRNLLHSHNHQRSMDVSKILICILPLYLGKCDLRDFSICHDDFNLKPPDGVLKVHTFPWLGFVQYLHVTTGLSHQSKAPRVVLIHKQFAVATATHMLQLPNNYKLRRIVFGDYERDEEDCGLTQSQVKLGVACPRAYIEMPFADITPHPEYTKFGVGNSLALIKLLRPVRSEYMIPICLPSISERVKKRKDKLVFMVDYISSVPTDFDSERMGKKTLKLYTHAECSRHRMRTNLINEGVTHLLCSSGCGVRAGAPIVSQSPEGLFQLVGIAASGELCSSRSMRRRRRLNIRPPLYIDVYPYVTWIINAIAAFVMPRPYPQSFMLVEGGTSMGINNNFLRAKMKQKSGWRARTYVSGNNCYKSVKKQKAAPFFYSERFNVYASAEKSGKLNVILKLSAGIECTIVCVRMLMPNRLSTPRIEGVGGFNVTIRFNTDWFPYSFYFLIGMNGRNSTEKDFAEWTALRRPGYW